MSRTVYRFRLGAVCLALVTLTFIQEPGRVAADSKLDLTANPIAFLGRALHMWDSTGFFGQVQNQAYGYLWPVGPLFAGMHLAQVVPWAAQRVWWSLLLVVGFLGFVRLSRMLGVRSALARVVGGLTFVLSVRVITELTAVSVEVWPMMIAPWVLIPLIAGAEGGSPRRWAGLSALAFLMTGAINAVASAAVLPLGVLWLATRQRSPRTWALAGWWSLGIVLASLWWAVPLLLLGQYSPPFLDWIEAAAITTSHNDPTSVLRGASHWVPYLVDAEGPVWPAGWRLVNDSLVVAATGVVTLGGLAGLLRPRVPERVFLVLVLCTGLVLTGLGHISQAGFGGYGASAFRDAMDGTLAPLRNVHKFQVLVTLPLAMGMAHLLAAVRVEAGAVKRKAASIAGNSGRRRHPRLVASMAATASLAAVALAAAPALGGDLVGGRSYLELPGYWREAADWLNEQDEGRALVVPAASFGVYMWGRSQDEPLQALDTQLWAVRDAVPLSSAGNIRFLDEVERRLGAGTGSEGLAPALARAGVRWLVVRNDLNTRATHATLPVLVHQALESSPGITRATWFGPILSSFDSSERIVDGGLLRAYPAVEVFRVAYDARTVDGKVAVRDASSVVEFTGSTEALPDLADSGLLAGSAAVALGDPVPPESRVSSVVTDTYRRAEANFGAAQRQYSNTLTAEDPFLSERRVHDYYPVSPGEKLSTAELEGASSVTASSSGSSPFALRSRSQAAQPWAALDGDDRTAWTSGDYRPGVGQWWKVAFDEPMDVRSLPVLFVGDSRVGSAPTKVRVSTDRGTRDVDVDPQLDRQIVRMPGSGPITWLRIELLQVREDGAGQGFGIAEVTLPDPVDRPVVTVPANGEGGVLLAARSMGREACVSTDTAIVCDSDLADSGEERAGIDRVIELKEGGQYRIETRLRPRPGAGLDAYLAAPANTIAVESSSQSNSDPGVRAQAAADQNPRTTWIASPLDRSPRLTVRLPEEQRVTGLLLQTAMDTPASRPLEVTVDVNNVSIPTFVDDSGRITLPEVRTDMLTLHFETVNPVRSIDSGTGASVLLPVGVTELTVLGSADRRMLQEESAAVPIPCGFGPTIAVDTISSVSTRVDGTVGDILHGQLAPGRGCGQTLHLDAGVHRLRIEPTQEWLVERVYLVPVESGQQPAPATATALPRIDAWSATKRAVSVGGSPRPRLLEFTENFNAGWQASLRGIALTPYRVDGWRQAFLIPAGSEGQITVVYGPDRIYRLGLVVGVVAVFALLVVTLLPVRRDPPSSVDPAQLVRTAMVTPIVASALTGGPWGLLAAVGVLVLVALLRRRRAERSLLVAQLVGLGGAGIALAAQAVWSWPSRSGAGPAYQLLLILGPACALGALAALAIPHLGGPNPGSASRGTPS